MLKLDVPKYTRVLSSGFEVGAILLLDVKGPAASFGSVDFCLMNETAKHWAGIRVRPTAFLQVMAYMATGARMQFDLSHLEQRKSGPLLSPPKNHAWLAIETLPQNKYERRNNKRGLRPMGTRQWKYASYFFIVVAWIPYCVLLLAIELSLQTWSVQGEVTGSWPCATLKAINNALALTHRVGMHAWPSTQRCQPPSYLYLKFFGQPILSSVCVASGSANTFSRTNVEVPLRRQIKKLLSVSFSFCMLNFFIIYRIKSWVGKIDSLKNYTLFENTTHTTSFSALRKI